MEFPTQFIPYLIFGFCITFFECFCSRRSYLFYQLSSEITTINGDIPQSSIIQDYVYYKTNNMTYSTLTDPLFGVSHQCGSLERNVQYCQWVEVQNTRTKKRGNKTITEYYYTYHKQWLRYQRSSIFYHNPIYHNPTVPTIREIAITGPGTIAGLYPIGPDMSLIGSRKYYYLDDSQILSFENSEVSSEFKYSGKGIFYSSYERDLLDKFLRVAQFFDLKSDLIDWCTPGDRRVWFEVWEPKNVTVIGELFDGIIQSFKYQDYKVGSVHDGDVKLSKILLDNASGFPTVMKWIFRILIILYFGTTVYDRMPDFLGLTALVFCIIMGYLAPMKFKMSTWGIVYLSVFCGVGVFLVKSQELNSH